MKLKGRPGDKLKDFYDKIYEPWALRSAKPRTKALYEITLRSFDKHLGRQARMRDLNDLEVSAYLSWHKKKDNAPHTISKERDNILAIWRFAARKRYVPEFPDVPPEPLPKKVPEAWTEEEMTRLYAACDVTKRWGSHCGIPCPLFWKTLLLVIWDTGERISAIIETNWNDLNLRTRWITVRCEVRKGVTEDKLTLLGHDTIAHLIQMKRLAKGEKIFEWPYTRTYLWDKFEIILIEADLQKKRAKFHKIRRSTASHYEAAGGNATELLGHSTRKVTTRYYLDPRIVPQQKPPSEVLFRLGEKRLR